MSVIPSCNVSWAYICICRAEAPGNFITYAVQFDNLLFLSPFSRLDPKTMQYIIGPPGALFNPRSKNKKWKKTQLQKKFLTFPEMELSSSDIRKNLIFTQKEAFFYISENGTLHFSAQARKKLHIYLRKRRPQKLLMFQKITFQTQKKKERKKEKRKRKHLKSFLYFGKWNFLATNLKKGRKELTRTQKTNIKSASTKFLVSLQQ